MLSQELNATIRECFRTASVRGKRQGEHCYFGEPLTDDDVWRHWVLFFGDYMTVGGMTLPMHSNVVACPQHDQLLRWHFKEEEK